MNDRLFRAVTGYVMPVLMVVMIMICVRVYLDRHLLILRAHKPTINTTLFQNVRFRHTHPTANSQLQVRASLHP